MVCVPESMQASIVVVHRFSCYEICGIFLDQGIKTVCHTQAVNSLSTAEPGKSYTSLNWFANILVRIFSFIFIRAVNIRLQFFGSVFVHYLYLSNDVLIE